MTEQNEWVSNRSGRLLTEVVTIDGRDYHIDRNDVFIRMGEEHPELRDDIVNMFERSGDRLARMKYPAYIEDLPVNERTIGFVRGLLALMPAENSTQQRAMDEAVATITEYCDDNALAVHRLTKETIAQM